MEEKINGVCGNRSRGCMQQSSVQAADGPARIVWCQAKADPANCRGAPEKNSGNWSSAPH